MNQYIILSLFLVLCCLTYSFGNFHSKEGMFDNNNEIKKSWTHLVGKNGEEAKTLILADLPGVKVHIVPQVAIFSLIFLI